MNHKEEMKYLKENDPILYSELTGNPTGSDDDSSCFGFWVFFIIGLILGAIIIS